MRKSITLFHSQIFFAKKYRSKALGLIVSIVGVVSIIPYLVLQLKGLGIIVSEASYGRVSPVVAVWIGAIVITIYVMVSGIHGSAWTAALKDIMILFIVMFFRYIFAVSLLWRISADV